MERYKKTLIGSVVAFVIGTSCCWISSLIVWIGGASVIGIIFKYIEDLQMAFLLVGGILLIATVYFKSKKSKW